jgi:hypothetical protein
MRQHVTVLGVLYIVLGAMGLMAAVIVLVVFGGLAGLAGVAAQNEPEAQIAVPILGAFAVGLFCLIGLLSAPGIIAGIGLIKFKSWARIFALVLSVINLLNIPFGTIIGIYGLWVLLTPEVEPLFRGDGVAEMPQASSPPPPVSGGQ